MLFGKRIKKRWEYEAEFRDASGREFGEFDIELSRIEKEESTDSLKAGFHLRHPSVRQHQSVQVYVEDRLVMEGLAEKDGYIRLGTEDLKAALDEPLEGKVCRVLVGGTEVASEPLKPD